MLHFYKLFGRALWGRRFGMSPGPTNQLIFTTLNGLPASQTLVKHTFVTFEAPPREGRGGAFSLQHGGGNGGRKRTFGSSSSFGTDSERIGLESSSPFGTDSGGIGLESSGLESSSHFWLQRDRKRPFRSRGVVIFVFLGNELFILSPNDPRGSLLWSFLKRGASNVSMFS